MFVGNRGYSLIQDSGTYRSSCGYCNDEGGLSSEAHGMHAYRLTVYDYQELLDQGWRRSGKYLYKPDNKVTCCRQYTIRLKADDFQPSKSHRKLLRKWEQFLAGHKQYQERPQGDIDANMTSCDQPGQRQQRDSSEGEAQQHRNFKRSRDSSNASGEQPLAQQHKSLSSESQEQLHPADLQSFVSRSSSGSAGLCSQVQSLLQQAAALVAQAGQLPGKGVPPVKVIIPPQQKISKMPAGTAFTSSSPHALAAAARKALQQQQQQEVINGGYSQQAVTADALSHELVRQFNKLAAAQPAVVGVVASAANGHVNFCIVQQQPVPAQQQEQPQSSQQWQQHRQQQQHQPSSAPHESEKQQQVQGHQQQQQQQQSMQSNGHSCLQQQQQVQGQQMQLQQQQQQQEEQAGPQQQQQQHLEVRMVPSAFIQEEYELYCKYQVSQHHDDPEELTPSRYRHFLVDSPLIPVAPQQNAPAEAEGAGGGGGGGIPACGYGSFHQQYWLDGRLIAVGVVDVLPRCLSSKYFFWDPDYAWLSLGRYGALREISWVAAANAAGAAQLQYYYLGFYIHNCPKMAYKAEYAPSELLCPERQVWVKIDKTVLQALDSMPYVVLSNLPGVEMRPNLSLPRQVPTQVPTPVPAAAGSAGAGAGHERLGLQRQMMFLLKQPVRWGALKESGLLDEAQIGELEERLSAWRAAVGETAAYLLYATPGDVLPVQ